MGAIARLRRIAEHFLSYGAHPQESRPQRGKRRILVGVFVVSVPILVLVGVFVVSVPILVLVGLDGLGSGQTWLAAIDLLTAAYLVAALLVLRYQPTWFAGIVNVVFLLAMLDTLANPFSSEGSKPPRATSCSGCCRCSVRWSPSASGQPSVGSSDSSLRSRQPP